MRLERVIKKGTLNSGGFSPLAWRIFFLLIFISIFLQVPTNFSRPIRTRRLQRLELSSSRLMNEVWRRFHRCRCRLYCNVPWPDIWIILPFASNVMERYLYAFNYPYRCENFSCFAVILWFVIKKELCSTFTFFCVCVCVHYVITLLLVCCWIMNYTVDQVDVQAVLARCDGVCQGFHPLGAGTFSFGLHFGF